MLIYFRLHVVNFGVPAKKSQTEQLSNWLGNKWDVKNNPNDNQNIKIVG